MSKLEEVLNRTIKNFDGVMWDDGNIHVKIKDVAHIYTAVDLCFCVFYNTAGDRIGMGAIVNKKGILMVERIPKNTKSVGIVLVYQYDRWKIERRFPL